MAEIPIEIEEYRDRLWRRDETLKVSSPSEVEELVDEVGICLALTDVRTPLPSVFIAVCGRRDAHSPKTVQKDPEASLAWTLKDDVMRRGNVWYSKLHRGRATFVSRDLISSFHAVHGISEDEEPEKLAEPARRVLEVLRKEWESSTSDLKEETGITDRRVLTRAIEDLQKCMKVIPYEVLYEPKFTYLWTLAEERFSKELAEPIPREEAVYRLAKRFLVACGMTFRADLSKATGIPRAEAGAANHRLVDEGFSERISDGVYRLKMLA